MTNHILHFDALIDSGLRVIGNVEDPHGVKAVLALDYLQQRFPEWSSAQSGAILDHSLLLTMPHVKGSLAGQVHSTTRLKPSQAERLLARGVFPLAYLAVRDWAHEVGVSGIVRHFTQAALGESNYLGHRLSIWLAFVEAAERFSTLRYQGERTQLLLERFAEFAAHAFAGFPIEESSWSRTPLPTSKGENFAQAFDAATTWPGFFGHHLIALAWVRRATWMSDDERQLAYRVVISLCHPNYVDSADRKQFAMPPNIGMEWDEADWSAILHRFLLAMPANLHIATLGDALAYLWDQTDRNGRQRLQSVMQGMVGDGVKLVTTRDERVAMP